MATEKELEQTVEEELNTSKQLDDKMTGIIAAEIDKKTRRRGILRTIGAAAAGALCVGVAWIATTFLGKDDDNDSSIVITDTDDVSGT